jgi:RHS repeat-associated protein
MEQVGQIIVSSNTGNITINEENGIYNNVVGRYAQTVGDKRYELSNHLGNVLQVLTDRKLAIDDGNGDIAYYTPDVVSQSDYYPFGMMLPNLNDQGADGYRYGFNGMEKDDEVKGNDNSYTTEFRQYDPRVARWLSIDPVVHHQFSPYSAFDNNPIFYTDPSGADSEDVNGPPKGKRLKSGVRQKTLVVRESGPIRRAISMLGGMQTVTKGSALTVSHTPPAFSGNMFTYDEDIAFAMHKRVAMRQTVRSGALNPKIGSQLNQDRISQVNNWQGAKVFMHTRISGLEVGDIITITAVKRIDNEDGTFYTTPQPLATYEIRSRKDLRKYRKSTVEWEMRKEDKTKKETTTVVDVNVTVIKKIEDTPRDRFISISTTGGVKFKLKGNQKFK